MPNQYHSLSFLAIPRTSMPSGTQVQSRHQMRVQSGVGEHIRIKAPKEDATAARYLSIPIMALTRTHSSPVIEY
jgi:hypothetical protein